MCKTLIKPTQAQGGWIFKWTTPKNSFAIPVIAGPFLQPKLVKALPYVMDNDKTNFYKHRNGIPDPWIDYLAWISSKKSHKKLISIDQHSADLGREYLRFTDYIWKKKGLAMVQGIPDPWKFVFADKIACNPEIRVKKGSKKSKIEKYNNLLQKKNSIEENVDELQGSIENIVNNKKRKRLKNQDGFDKVKQRLSEIEAKLKLKSITNSHRATDVDKYLTLKSKYSQNENKMRRTKQVLHADEIEKLNFKKESFVPCVPNQRLDGNYETKIISQQKKSFQSQKKKHRQLLSVETTSNSYKDNENISALYKMQETINNFQSRDHLNEKSEDSDVKSPEEESACRLLKKRICETEKISTPDLFFERIYDKEAKDYYKEEETLNLDRNIKKGIVNSCTPNQSIIINNNRGCLKNCQKKNCALYCSDTFPKNNELIVESFSDKNE